MASTKKKTKNAALGAFTQGKPKGFMRNRFLAEILDFVIIALICQLLFALLGKPDWGGYMQMQEAVAGLEKTDPLVIERMRLYQESFLITLGVLTAYEAVTLIPFGSTIGKLIFRLRVVNFKEGRSNLVFRLMLVLRTVLKALSIYLLSAIPFIFMCLSAFASAEGRSGFDMFTGTKVIDLRSARK